MKKEFIIVACLILSFTAFGQIRINEIFAENKDIVYNPETGGYTDYIELYNAGLQTVNIGGYMLSDSDQNPSKWQFPAGISIQSRSFLIVWADGENTGLHTNFKLSKQGETLLLSDASGVMLDRVSFPMQADKQSFGRQPDGSGDWMFLTQPTPGKVNNSPATIVPPARPVSSVEAGFYPTEQTVSLHSPSGAQLYYTTDGSEPTVSSKAFTGDIRITKTTVIRSVAIDATGTSEVLTVSVFIGERKFDLPIVSLSTDHKHFFDDKTGIYVEGTNGITGRCMETPANWNQDWERPASFEYFSPDGMFLFQKDSDVRILGGCSRTNPQKSLTLVARSGRYEYPFFETRQASSYKSIVLRNSGNDWGGGESPGTMMRDAFMQKLVQGQMDIDVQDYRPVAVFLNGKYWGLHNMREHLNENYIANIHPEIDKDNIDLIKNHWDIKEGDEIAFKELMSYAEKTSFVGEEGYARAQADIDIPEYINYQLSQIFFSNGDWPANNIRFYRERTEKGKWRFIVFDTDFGFGIWGNSPYHDNLSDALSPNGPSWPNSPQSTLLFRKLMENEQFRHRFIQTFAVEIYNTFTQERINTVIDSIKDGIASEMVYQLKRWYKWDNSIEEWSDRVDKMKTWGKQRRPAMMDIIRNYYSLDSPITIKTRVTAGDNVRISLAGASLKKADSDIRCFPNIPITIEAFVGDGFVFSHWEDDVGTIVSGKSKYTFIPKSNRLLRPVIMVRPATIGLVINEVFSSKQSLESSETANSNDYLELFNASTLAIDLSGLYLSDDFAIPNKFALTSDNELLTIQPGEHLTLWADADIALGARHIRLKIKKSGGQLILSRIDGGKLGIIDNVEYGALADNQSYGRFPSGQALFATMLPTPSSHNTKAESAARLSSLTFPMLPVFPAFHPDSTVYSIYIPQGFDAAVLLTAEAYCGGTVTVNAIDKLTNTITVTVISADKSARQDYVVSLRSYEVFSTKLASLTVTGGTLSEEFSPDRTHYTIRTDGVTTPQISWTLASDKSSAVFVAPQGPRGHSSIMVTSPMNTKRLYQLTVADRDPAETGVTINFDGGEVVRNTAASYTVDVSGGELNIVTHKRGAYDPITIKFDREIDVSNYPYIEVGMKTNKSLKMRIDFVDADNNATNGNDVVRSVKAGAHADYLYEYHGLFYAMYPEYSKVDSTRIRRIWICFNPGEVGLNAESAIDYIKVGSHVNIAGASPFLSSEPSLYLSDGKLIPDFSASVFNYNIVDYSQLPQLFAVSSDDNATISTVQINEATGRGSFTISSDSQAPRTYNFTLRPEGLSSNADLLSLRSSNGSLSPAFNADVLEYTSIEPTKKPDRLLAITVDKRAKYATIAAPSSYQNSYVIVTAEDGTVKIYTVLHKYTGDDAVSASVEIADSRISIFPNPTADYFMFDGCTKADISLHSISGAQLAQWSGVVAEQELSLAGISPQTAFVSIKTESAELWFVLLIQ